MQHLKEIFKIIDNIFVKEDCYFNDEYYFDNFKDKDIIRKYINKRSVIIEGVKINFRKFYNILHYFQGDDNIEDIKKDLLEVIKLLKEIFEIIVKEINNERNKDNIVLKDILQKYHKQIIILSKIKTKVEKLEKLK